jgi:Trk K+ transport system NAD-binding subunit
MDEVSAQHAGAIVVCGLGRLGLECALQLKAFGAPVIGVSRRGVAPDDLPRFDRVVTGDCARTEVLKAAGVATCRAILLLTDDPRSNVAAAFAARRLNPRVRIVIRSAQENLNSLLAEQLGDLIAFEPGLFSTRAFAVAALADETRARFNLEGARTSVVAHRVEAGDWCDGRTPPELHSLHLRVIGHHSGAHALVDGLATMPGACETIGPGDEITFVVNGDMLAPAKAAEQPANRRKPRSWASRRLRASKNPATVATLASLVAVIALTLGAVLLYRHENPELTWFDAVNVAVVLGVGGFDNVFGALKAPFPISPMLYAYSLLMKIGSAVLLGIVFANFTEKLLGARFAIAPRRPEPPAQGHSVIVGLGPLGQSVALQLRQWGRPVAGVADAPPAEVFLPDMAIESGAIREALARANVATARSVVVAGDDQIANLEVMLLARSLNPRCALVFRVADSELSANISALIPDCVGINDAEVAAQAIAGAAFGESILSAFRLGARSILVTQYLIETGDTLIDRLLAHVAYGYGVVPVLHERGAASALNPSDDIKLESGDTLVVLATLDALGRIERGEWRAPQLHLEMQACVIASNAFEAGNLIARIAGCDLATARKALQNLPRRLETPLYPAQGLRLARELKKLGVIAKLEA